jgi:von Willebrand factor type A domain
MAGKNILSLFLLSFSLLYILLFANLGCGGCVSDDDSDDDNSNNPCYEDTLSGCSSFSWSDIKFVIEAIYLFDDTYFGYDREEALDLAKSYYENGVYPESYLLILGLEELDGGKWRAYTIVTGEDGFPVENLTPDQFLIEMDDSDDFVTPTRVQSVRNALSEDVNLISSLVVDDSGSITDCDANFVAKGLSHLLETLPPFYTANLFKFGNDVLLAQDWTSDSQALIDAMWNVCDRGATSLWDALDESVASIPETRTGLRVSVVFTDGLDNDSSSTLNDVIDSSLKKRVPVFAVGLGMADIFALGKLARETNGGLFYIPTGEEVFDAFELITTFMMEAYVIEWEAADSFSEVKIYAEVIDGNAVSDVWEE